MVKFLATLSLVSGMLIPAPLFGLPIRIEIEPNAVQDPSRPMVIEVNGIPEGQAVLLQILQDCNGDGHPDIEDVHGCRSPLYQWNTVPAGRNRTIYDRLDFHQLELAGHLLPRETLLWIRASLPDSTQGVFARFGLVVNPCTLWQSTIDTFLRGTCNPGLAQALRHHRGPMGLQFAGFEVRRVSLTAEDPTPLAVPGTLGSSGVAWLDDETLLITVAQAAPDKDSFCLGAADDTPEATKPGLWRISLRAGVSPVALWMPAPGEVRIPTAPLGLPGGRIAFVRQEPRDQLADSTDVPAVLSVWEGGRIDPTIEVPLPKRIHQLVASAKEGESLLALTLGAGADHPSFLEIDLRNREVRDLGFDAVLFQAAFRSPIGEDAVISFEDSSGEYGWDLALVDGRGIWKRDVQRRSKDDLLPAWRPDGGEVAFLAEADRRPCQVVAPKGGRGETHSVDPPTQGKIASNLEAHVFDRVLSLLSTIPKRWANIRSPMLAVSEWSPSLIPEGLTRDDVRAARAFIAQLASSPLEERQSLIQSELTRRQVTELDLWIPELVAKESGNDTTQAALLIEAWLEWAEALGRRDVLLVAASYAIELTVRHFGTKNALSVSRTWAELPYENGIRGRARLLRCYGLFLFFSGANPHANEQALDNLNRAQLLFHSARDSPGEGNALIAKADVLLFLGHAESALAALRTARSLYELTNNKVGAGNAFNLEGDIQENLGEHEMAVDAYRRSIPSFQEADSEQGQAIVLSDLGDALVSLGRYDEAIAAYQRSGFFLASAGDPLDKGNTLKGEAEALRLAGRYKQALVVYEKALLQYRIAGDKLGQGNVYRGQAQLLIRIQDWKGAARAANRSLRCLRRFKSPPAKILALTASAIAKKNLGRKRRAVAAAMKAIRLHTLWRATRIAEPHRNAADLDIAGAYEVLIATRSRQRGRAGEALQFAERARSRVLLDLLAAEPRDESRSAVNLMVEQQRIETELAGLESLPGNAQGFESQRDIASERRYLDRKLEWNRYEILVSQESVLRTAVPLDTAAIRALSRETGPILLYYVADSGVLVFLVQPGDPKIHVWEINLTWDQVHKNIHELAYQLANPLHEAQAQRLARELWNSLIAPVAGLLPRSGSLVIIPHGPLHELPFEALLDPSGIHLSERWDVSFAPSASALAFARRRHRDPQATDAFLAFSSGRGLSLPVSEATEVARFFGAGQAMFHPTDAYFETYKSIASEASQLLIASRGVHVEGSRTGTYLEILRTEKSHDSRLTAAEIATIPIRAELVTLAACDTSHGEVPYSDERLTLTRAFLVAGAAAVLATRWKVPEDAATSRFLIDFFRLYRHGGPGGGGLRKDVALSLARQLARERGDPAQVWASWVLIGDPR